MTTAYLQVGASVDFSDLSYIREPYRRKVACDLLNYITGEKRWNFTIFDPHNDYQRHLFALFLRMSGWLEGNIANQLFALSDDVELQVRTKYVNDVLHSEIVGFRFPDGSLEMIPNQRTVEV